MVIKLNETKNIIEKALQKNKIDALFLSSKSAARYVTGIDISEGFVFACQNSIYHIVDFRYIEAAKTGKNTIPLLLEGSVSDCLLSLCSKYKIKSLGYEEDNLTAEQYFKYSKTLSEIVFIPSAFIIKNLRISKNEDELNKIRKAQEITDLAFTHILKIIKPGISEREIALELDYFIRKNGGNGSAFETIALTGKNTSMPHGIPGETKVKDGDFVLLDFGVDFNGYRSDMTRTVAVSYATDQMKAVYETVSRAQVAALSIIKSGMTGKEADKIARDIIDSTEYEGSFGHSLGHGVGLDIHELPNFSMKYENAIPHNAVMSVEPGIYLEGLFGVRIEDLVIVKKDGVENLTKSPKELLIL